MRSVLATALACISLAVLLTACGPAETPPGGETGQPGAQGGGAPPAPTGAMVKRGGVLNLDAGAASYAGTDPAMGQQSYNVWPIIGEYLMRIEPETSKVVPAGIERWEYSPDGMTLTLHVRKGVKFHNKPPVNGREIQAKDVIYTLKGMTGELYPHLPTVRFPRRSNVEQMKQVEAVDQYTVKVTLTEPSASFLHGLAEYRSGIILPDGLREAFGGTDALVIPDVARYIAAGPFILTKFVNQVEVLYERNPDYYEQAADSKPKPYLDRIYYVWIPDAGTANAAFIAGQTDYVSLTNPDYRQQILSQRKDTQVATYAPSSCWHRLAFNMTRKPFDDVRVRKAIGLVMDPVEMGKQFYGEWDGKPLWRYPGPLPWVFAEALPQDELAKLPGYRLPKDQDIAEARRLLAEAGLSGGFEFEMMSPSTSKDQVQLTQSQIQNALPGMKIIPKLVDNSVNLELAAKGEFTTQLYCYIHEATGIAMLKTPYHTKGGRNFAKFSNARMDDLLDRAARELDVERRTQLMQEAQRLALEHMPYKPAYHYATQTGLQPYVRGMRFGSATIERTWFKEVWLDK